MVEKKRQTLTKWKIVKLKEHPQQSALFGDIPDAELAALVTDIKANGLRDPVEILPDGTIVAGHQRVRAARKLGWKEIDVIVRHDLAKAGAAATEAYFISSNLIRRQLTPLGRARGIQCLMENELKVGPGGLFWDKKEALIEEIGRRLGMSGRNVNRYLLVLKAPVTVQQAFERGELSLGVAGRVAMLEADDKEAIVQRIQAGELARRVVAGFIAARFKNRGGADRPFRRLMASFDRELPLIRGQAECIDADRLGASLPVLQDAKAVLAELIEAASQGAA